MDSATKEIESRKLYELCHDIKTPLSTIMGMTVLTRNELDDRDKVSRRLDQIETASKYLLSMVNDLLDYSILENGSMAIRKDAFNIGRIIDLIEKLYAPQFKKKKQTFNIKKQDIFQEELLGDYLRISQVLANLLTNAAKYTGEGGRVALVISQIPLTESTLMLEMMVIDNGIGMSEGFMGRMFEPYSIENGDADTRSEATGLGLYITHNLVTLMGGDISVKSRLKSGSIFTVRIPCDIPKFPPYAIKDSNRDGSRQNPKEASFHSENYDFKGRCFLVAEDNPEVLDITIEMLMNSGAKVLPFNNGLQLIEYYNSARREKANAILVDLHMSVMDGLEATARIRRSGRPDASIPIIALTASDDPTEYRFSIETGIDEIVKKPVDYGYLYSLLNRYTEQV
ncbi:hypothetical protein MASR2M70_00570 [Bacillota bacterium]